MESCALRTSLRLTTNHSGVVAHSLSTMINPDYIAEPKTLYAIHVSEITIKSIDVAACLYCYVMHLSLTTRNVAFIRPFEKRTYYAVAMSVHPSVRLSVRPSVRPSFPDFFQHALRYQFETWYMHSVDGTTCRVWVSSQLGHFDLVYSQK